MDLSNHHLNFFRVDIEAYPNHLLDGRSQNTLPKLWKQLGQTLKPRPPDRSSSSSHTLSKDEFRGPFRGCSLITSSQTHSALFPDNFEVIILEVQL